MSSYKLIIPRNLWSLNLLGACMGSILVRSNILKLRWPHPTCPTLHLGSSNSRVAPLGLLNTKLTLNKLNCWSTSIEPLHSFELTSPCKWCRFLFNFLWSTQSMWASRGPLDDHLMGPKKLNEHKDDQWQHTQLSGGSNIGRLDKYIYTIKYTLSHKFHVFIQEECYICIMIFSSIVGHSPIFCFSNLKLARGPTQNFSIANPSSTQKLKQNEAISFMYVALLRWTFIYVRSFVAFLVHI